MKREKVYLTISKIDVVGGINCQPGFYFSVDSKPDYSKSPFIIPVDKARDKNLIFITVTGSNGSCCLVGPEDFEFGKDYYGALNDWKPVIKGETFAFNATFLSVNDRKHLSNAICVE